MAYKTLHKLAHVKSSTSSTILSLPILLQYTNLEAVHQRANRALTRLFTLPVIFVSQTPAWCAPSIHFRSVIQCYLPGEVFLDYFLKNC